MGPFWGSFMIRTVLPWVSHSGWVPSLSSWFICAARRSWSAVSFFSQYVWIISGPGAVQLFIFDTLSWMSAIEMVTGSCPGMYIIYIPNLNLFLSIYGSCRSCQKELKMPAKWTITWNWTVCVCVRVCVCVCPAFINLDSLSNMSTSFMASYSFCSSVIPSMGFGCSSSTTPVIGFILGSKEIRYKISQKNRKHVKKKSVNDATNVLKINSPHSQFNSWPLEVEVQPF